LLARLLVRHKWIGYVGVVLILWVSLKMIWDGSHDVMTRLGISLPGL
jgi:predicted tellurium resistance membrane protein TerC